MSEQDFENYSAVIRLWTNQGEGYWATLGSKGVTLGNGNQTLLSVQSVDQLPKFLQQFKDTPAGDGLSTAKKGS